MTFVHTFVVSPLKRYRSGIFGIDFQQQVRAEISLTAQLLNIGHYSFLLRDREGGVSPFRRVINAGSGGSSCIDQEGRESEPVGEWEGTVEVAEAVRVSPISVSIARCRVVKRDDSPVVKVSWNQEVLVDLEGLPGMQLAGIITTLEYSKSSSNVGGSPRLWSIQKSLR